ncbi:hypothetical protein HN908_00540, partial [Candidatus Woesearchaeota archaeon]|nr:hypothetical protein [Candidatus Woesearchaeota archaeon]
MKKRLLLLFIFIFVISNVNAAIIADHNAVIAFDNGDIPSYWIEQVKSERFLIQFPGRSHSQQLVGDFDDNINTVFIGGLEKLEDMDSIYQVDIQCDLNDLSSSNGALRFIKGQYSGSSWGAGSGQYECRNDDDHYWSTSSGRQRTLDSADESISLGDPFDASMFGWSFHIIRGDSIHNEGGSDITFNEERRDAYFNSLDEFRSNSPNTEYIYGTAPTDQDTSTPISECGVDGERVTQYNQDIRDEAISNDGVLFDQADIEYHGEDMQPPSSEHPCGEGSTIQIRHPDWGSGSDGCAHSNSALCVAKAKAVWWMAARMVGWDGIPACQSSGDCEGNNCVEGICQGVIEPQITSVSNSVLIHGESFSISGSGLGVKDDVSPHTYDNFDDGIVVDRWHWEYGSSSYYNLFSDVTTELRTPYSIFNAKVMADTDWNESGGGMADSATFFSTHDHHFTSEKWYSSMWVKFSSNFVFDEDVNGVWGNVKIFRNLGSANQYVSIGGDRWGLAREYAETTVDRISSPTPSDMDLSRWHHLEYEFYENTGNGIADGKMKLFIDGKMILFRSNIITQTADHPGLKRTFIPAGFHSVRDPQADGEYLLFDEVYVDSSVARIMICDFKSWGTIETTGGHCELQLPHTIWDGSNIQFTANKGSFGDEQLYLFVIDSEGEVSNGVPVSFDGTAPQCDLTSASWGETEVEEGTEVSLNVQGNNCDGQEVSFEIWENDIILDDPVNITPSNVYFSGSSAVATWIAEYQNDVASNPEYRFRASLVDGGDNIESSNELIVSEIVIPFCGDGTCDIGENFTSCPEDCETS